MAKGGTRPPNGPSTTGKPSGGGRGNNPPLNQKASNKLDFSRQVVRDT